MLYVVLLIWKTIPYKVLSSLPLDFLLFRRIWRAAPQLHKLKMHVDMISFLYPPIDHWFYGKPLPIHISWKIMTPSQTDEDWAYNKT